MNDPPGAQAVALGDLALPRFAPVQGTALFQQLGPGRPVDGPVHSAPAQEGFIGRVHDGVNLLLDDIALDDFNPVYKCFLHHTFLSLIDKDFLGVLVLAFFLFVTGNRGA
jgi:hypothetical protein